MRKPAPLDPKHMGEFVMVPGNAICKQCGFPYDDDSTFLATLIRNEALAKSQGFCSAGCQEVYEKVKELEERFARQEGR